jgi:hypothetical protein
MQIDPLRHVNYSELRDSKTGKSLSLTVDGVTSNKRGNPCRAVIKWRGRFKAPEIAARRGDL